MRGLGVGVVLALSGVAAGQPTCTGGFTSDSGFIGADAAMFGQPKVNCGLRWDPDGPGPSPEVFVAGGNFTSMDGTPANGVAVWDGRTWTALGGGLRASSSQDGVTGLVLHNGELHACGQIGISDTQGNHRVAKWNGLAWEQVGPILNGPLTCVESFGGNLYVGGDFTISGQQGSDFARLNGGAWQTFTGAFGVGPGTSNTRVEAVIHHAGDLVISGNFPWRVARFNGGPYQGFGQPVACQFSCSGGVTAMLSEGTDLYVAGDFRTSTQTQPGVMRWDGAAWTAMTYAGHTGARSISRWNGDLYVCTGTSNQASSILRWNGTQWLNAGPQRWYGPTVIAIEAVGEYEGRMVLGGNFGPYDWMNNGDYRYVRCMSAYDGSTIIPVSRGVNARITAMIEWNGETVGVGRFTAAGGEPAAYIAIRDDEGVWRPFESGFNGHAWTAALAGGGFVVGGQFTTAGGENAQHIAEWREGAWHAMGPGLTSYPAWIGVVGGQIWAATTTDPGRLQAFNGVFAWDGSAWSAVPYPAGAARFVQVGTELYTSAPGEFGFSTMYRWNGAAFEAMPRPAGVSSIGLFGSFQGDLLGAATGGAIYRWDGAAWSDAGQMPTTSMGTVGSMSEGGGLLYLGADGSSGTMQILWSWDGFSWANHGNMPINPQPSWGLTSTSIRPPVVLGTSDGALMGGAFLYTNQNYSNAQSFAARMDASWRPRSTSGPARYIHREIGESVSLAWGVTGSVTSYRWYKDSEALSDGELAGVGTIAGATTTELSITGLQSGAAGRYWCYANTPCGLVQLSPTTLDLPAPCDADVNCDGAPDQGDVACIILAVAGDVACFCQADPDFNLDGVPDQGDVTDVITVVAGGPCP